MRLVTYESNGNWRAGVIVDDNIVDSTTAATAADINFDTDLISNRQIIQLNPGQRSQFERAAFAIADAHPAGLMFFPSKMPCSAPPIPDPDKIICLGLNYRRHAEEAGFPIPEVPILFAKYRNSLNGPTSPIILPGVSEQIDYEAELAVVIGKQCKNISSVQAPRLCGGIYGLQRRQRPRSANADRAVAGGKSFRYICPLRPCVGDERNQ